MFEATFVGHQGWMVRTATTTVLIDPLLTDRFGHGGLVGALYPPRTVDPSAFPPIDAVIVTHEHDDHFDLPSLHRLDRSIPVFLSARSSKAAHDIVRDLGFCVHPLHSDQPLTLGDLHYHPLCADHREGRHGDEWDVFPFVVHDVLGHGSLMSSVDVPLTESMLARVQKRVPRPGLWAYAHNTTNTRFQDASDPGHPLPDDGPMLARVAGRRLGLVQAQWGPPAAMLICGGGWSFDADRAWLNHHAFPLAPARLRAALASDYPDQPVIVPTPGQAITMERGRLRPDHVHGPGAITTAAASTWPSREYRGDGARLGDYGPACGRRTIEPDERAALIEALSDLARFLYGGPLFRQLHSLPTAPARGPLPAVGLSLRTTDAPLVLRYAPRECRFIEMTDLPASPASHSRPAAMDALLSGLECWARDLLALLRGEIGPTALCYAGRLRVWNHDPQRLRFSPHVLWMLAHPLRRPAAAAALYRRLADALGDDGPRIRGTSGS